MLEIQVAGAGAGKTYELAKKLLHKLKSSNTEKKFYALTFTNSAKEKIESELIKQKGCIPERVIVETVHSFLLNEIIYPFSYYITDIKYHSSSVIFLGSNDRFKAIKVKRLKDAGFVHVDKVYSVSKKIIDKNTSGKTVAIKSKVDNIILLSSFIIISSNFFLYIYPSAAKVL